MGRARIRERTLTRERTVSRADDPNYTDSADEKAEDIQAIFQERGMDETEAENRARDAKQRIEKSKHTGKRIDRGQNPTKNAARKGGAATKQGKTSKTTGVGSAAKKSGAARKSSVRKTPAVREAEQDSRKTFSEREQDYSPAEPHRGRKLSKR